MLLSRHIIFQVTTYVKVIVNFPSLSLTMADAENHYQRLLRRRQAVQQRLARTVRDIDTLEKWSLIAALDLVVTLARVRQIRRFQHLSWLYALLWHSSTMCTV